ncbi:MAG TPA: NAD(P)/FAD-dependent oxidoreductase [Candidatus Brocadiia bacterium]|nr:NAD(P)/FAD-dependent oxidoreductase [Planctomycetota bacterium]MDO8092331.1 NAD(P)/FAD-dependent oxidoreductase [Candidatus Brocadiales bacterium]
MDYDVVIVGAGPSGAAAARTLVNGGLNVLIIERKKLPRAKMCSGLINDKSLKLTRELFGEIPESAYARPELLKAVRLWHTKEDFTDWPLNENSEGAPNIWRSKYDEWLVKSSGAVIKDCCTLLSLEQHNNPLSPTRSHAQRGNEKGGMGGISLHCKNEQGKTVKFKGTYLIGADGSKSTVRAAIDPEFEKGLGWLVAIQQYCEGTSTLDAHYFNGFLDPKFSEVYAWFNMKDDLLIFGTAVKRGSKFEPYFLEFKRFLEDNFELRAKKVVMQESCIGNNMASSGNFHLGKGNVLLVGEGAGFLNMFGEGISSALATGKLAGEAILEGIKTKKDALSIYTASSRNEKVETFGSWKLAARIAGRRVME